MENLVRPVRAAALRTDAIRLRMSSNAALTLDESKLLLDSGALRGRIWPRQSMLPAVVNGAAPSYIASGWAAHARPLRDGRRQIVQILLPGDPIIPLPPGEVRQEIVCLTPVRSVDGEAIHAAARNPERFPGIAAAIARATVLHRMELTEQIVRLGRQTAQERMAGMLLDLYRRCAVVGLVEDSGLTFPLTQDTLADLLGLSIVHVNRTLQQLRRDGLIELKHGNLRLPQPGQLTEIAVS